MFSLPVAAQTHSDAERVERLLEELHTAPDPRAAERVAAEIELEWSKSGSAAMDLLLKRGRDALERGDLDEAIGHLTALTDHAPDFAEGWYMRALAFFRRERYGMAAADLERALALNPLHFGALRGLGAIFEQLDEPKRAHEVYEKVLSINPQDKEVIEAMERLRRIAVGVEL